MKSDIGQLEEVNKEYLKIFNRYFEGIRWSSAGCDSSFSFHAELSFENRNYKRSNYYYDLAKNRKFIHFTTLPRLFSILSEKALRLYSLTNSNDAKEYEHTAEVLNLNPGWQKHAKENSFTFSFCEPCEFLDENLWVLYADNKRGCCIEFEIINDQDTWKNYHISGVKYEKLDAFIEFQKSLDALKEKYPGAQFHSELSRLMIFHKSEKWAGEKEVRLATYMGDYNGNHDKRTKDVPIEMRISDGDEVRFIEFVKLPLALKEPGTALLNEFQKSPQLKISRILLGEKIPIPLSERQQFCMRILRALNNKIGSYSGKDYIQVLLHSQWRNA